MSREEVMSYFAARSNNPEAQRGDALFKQSIADNNKIAAQSARIAELEEAFRVRLNDDICPRCAAPMYDFGFHEPGCPLATVEDSVIDTAREVLDD